MTRSRVFLSLATSSVLLASPLAAMARSADGLPPPPSTRGSTSTQVQSRSSSSMSRSSASSAPSTPMTEPAMDEDAMMDELMDTIGNPARPVPSMGEGKGGGMDASMSIMPYPGMSGISVDATHIQQVTPDYIGLNAYCEAVAGGSRAEVKAELDQKYNAMKASVGTDGTIRRAGSYSIYPWYDPVTGRQETDKFTGNLSVFIRITKLSASNRVADAVESVGCNSNWDVRLTDTQSHETAILDRLIERMNKRKAMFEKLLGTKLTKIIGASMYTWVDGYASYDPETNKADATTTLTVIFEAPGASSSSSR